MDAAGGNNKNNNKPADEWEEHLEELRGRIIKVLAVFCVFSLGSFAASGWIVRFLTSPASSIGVSLYTFSPAAKFMAYINISVLSGAVLALPFFILQFCLFIWPGLKAGERRYALFAVCVVPVLFMAGSAAAYRFFAPVALKFFMTFASGDGVEALWGFREYISLLAGLMLAAGALLQMPVFLLALFALGVTTPRRVASFRPYAILIIFFLAGVCTPPDVASQVMLGVPLYLIFELTLLAGRAVRRRG
jgi:sec-independent protein translocase protein TatC